MVRNLPKLRAKIIGWSTEERTSPSQALSLLLERLTQTWKAWDCRQAPLSKALKLKHNYIKVKTEQCFKLTIFVCLISMLSE